MKFESLENMKIMTKIHESNSFKISKINKMILKIISHKIFMAFFENDYPLKRDLCNYMLFSIIKNFYSNLKNEVILKKIGQILTS